MNIYFFPHIIRNRGFLISWNFWKGLSNLTEEKTEIVGRLNNRSLYPSEVPTRRGSGGHTSDYWAMQYCPTVTGSPKAVLAFPVTEHTEDMAIEDLKGQHPVLAFGGGSTSRGDRNTNIVGASEDVGRDPVRNPTLLSLSALIPASAPVCPAAATAPHLHPQAWAELRICTRRVGLGITVWPRGRLSVFPSQEPGHVKFFVSRTSGHRAQTRSACHDPGPQKDASSSYDADLPGRERDTGHSKRGPDGHAFLGAKPTVERGELSFLPALGAAVRRS